MSNNSNDKDILALETISELKNYNNYTFKIIEDSISGKKVLDFGSGYGVFSQYIQNKGFDVDALEINETAIKESRLRGINTFSNINDLNEKYDTVVSLNVLEHVKDDTVLMNQMKSLLSKNGYLILYLPASNFIWSQMDDDVNHLRRYSKKDLKQKLESLNFEIVFIRYVDFIGWAVLVIFKFLRVKPKFNKKLLIFYDKVFFRLLKYLDILFQKIIGKNLFVIARIKE
tara:strand:- start:2476 stop:3162 length:687 start_codon:yes stop_codon:yes gene_type:complete